MNIVVTTLNAEEDPSEFLSECRPSRIKLLKCTIVPGENDDAAHLVCSPKAFAAYHHRLTHLPFPTTVVAETEDDIYDTYAMVGPNGGFRQAQRHRSGDERTHHPSRPGRRVGAGPAAVISLALRSAGASTTPGSRPWGAWLPSSRSKASTERGSPRLCALRRATRSCGDDIAASLHARRAACGRRAGAKAASGLLSTRERSRHERSGREFLRQGPRWCSIAPSPALWRTGPLSEARWLRARAPSQGPAAPRPHRRARGGRVAATPATPRPWNRGDRRGTATGDRRRVSRARAAGLPSARDDGRGREWQRRNGGGHDRQPVARHDADRPTRQVARHRCVGPITGPQVR